MDMPSLPKTGKGCCTSGNAGATALFLYKNLNLPYAICRDNRQSNNLRSNTIHAISLIPSKL